MSPLVARWCLVGPAVVLLFVGVVADLSAVARTALLLAAASCAVLDALTVRADGADGRSGVVVTLPAAAGTGSTALDGGPATGSVESSSDPGPLAAADRVVVEGMVLGRRPDGRAEQIRADPPSPFHVVVLGAGSYARAVFDALGAQLAVPAVGRTAGAVGMTDPDVRVVSDAGTQAGAPHGVRPTPTGTAVAVRLDGRGRARVTVVLVPGVHMLPRRRDRVVEVTRHGCRLWSDGDGAVTPLEPVLPLLVSDPVRELVGG